MKIVLSLLVVAASVLCSEGALQQWVLQYTGYCDTNKTDSFRKCYGKAQSQDMTSSIDSDDGVDFSITKLYIGPVSEIFVIESFTTDEDYTATGNMTFGTYNSITTTLGLSFTSEDIDTYYDANGDYASIGSAVITSGTGAWASASGEVTMNTLTQQDEDNSAIMDWTAIFVGNVVKS